ncbi:MAG: hypothetical protein Q7T36_01975 [Fluviicoccus sp.]|nr:DUF6670 family protein [Fluviicoccus sp.]MDO8329220.1 hypothetical protein [Fluviicoccus sp.]
MPKSLTNAVERSLRLNGNPFDPGTSVAPPQGRYTCVHYGIMVPNLPPPYNFLNLITVIGQPKVKLFRNSHLIKTTALDTANVLVGTAIGTPDHFNGYSVARDCELRPDGSYLRFGDDLVIEGRYPNFTARRSGKAFNFVLELRATSKIAHFAKMLGGVYDHWALLCEYTGHIEHDGLKTPLQGLCTFEYARVINLSLPLRFFTYQILNIDARTQVLMVVVLGPLNAELQRRVYVRSLDDHGGTYTHGFDFIVHEHEAESVVTPDGTAMRLPKKFSWRVDDESGNELISIGGSANGDFKYGMAGGYAGSYGYRGRFKGRPIDGTGYIEYIDCR